MSTFEDISFCQAGSCLTLELRDELFLWQPKIPVIKWLSQAEQHNRHDVIMEDIYFLMEDLFKYSTS